MIILEDFINDVVTEARKRSGIKDICINWIGQFYPEFFEDAVEACIINTAIIEERADIIENIQGEHPEELNLRRDEEFFNNLHFSQ